jgi:hypothetical protein
MSSSTTTEVLTSEVRRTKSQDRTGRITPSFTCSNFFFYWDAQEIKTHCSFFARPALFLAFLFSFWLDALQVTNKLLQNQIRPENLKKSKKKVGR